MANADVTWRRPRARTLVAMLGMGAVAGCGAVGVPAPHRSTVAAHRSVSTAATAPSRRPGAARTVVLGRSEGGRRIVAIRAGDAQGPRVLVVGAIHGDELAGIAVARALERTRTGADLWVVPDLNPDGAARGTRQDGRGVDLNANWSSQWHGGGRPWDVYYPGPRPFSEREARIARSLILRVRPQVTIWYHQHMDVVWAWGPSTAAGRRYARAAGMRLYHHHWLPGTASNWQNHHLPTAAAFTVELPAGSLTRRQVRRQVRAVLAVGAAAR
jgi:protein MpaA